MSAPLVQRILVAGQGSSLRAELVRGAMGVGGLRVISLVLTLAVSVLLARALGPEGFGRYTFIISVVMVLSLPLDKGMRELITREVASYQHAEDWALLRGLLQWANRWVLIGSLVLGATFGSLAFYHATWELTDRWTLLLLGLLLVPLLGLNALRGANLRGLGYVIYAQLPELLVRPGSHLVTAALLLALGLLNPITALLSQAVAAAGAFLLGAYLLHRRRLPRLKTVVPVNRSKEWRRAWLPFTLLMAAGMLNNQMAILLLGWLGTDVQVAALRVADRGAQLVALSLGITNLVIAPHVTRAYRETNQKRLQQLFRQTARVALSVAVPIALPLVLFGAPIVALIFGEQYVEIATKPLAIMVMAQLFNVGFGSVGLFLVMTGFERKTLTGQIIAVFVSLLAAILLIPPLGAEGAAYASAIGLVTWNCVLGFTVFHRLALRPGVI